MKPRNKPLEGSNHLIIPLFLEVLYTVISKIIVREENQVTLTAVLKMKKGMIKIKKKSASKG